MTSANEIEMNKKRITKRTTKHSKKTNIETIFNSNISEVNLL